MDDNGQYKSIYKPTHLLKTSEGEDGQEEPSYSLFSDAEEYSTAGYTDQDTYDKAKMTRVAYVWDKITRRLLMYNDKDWSWPIWVWDDPHQLDQFFPLVPLTFHEGPWRRSSVGRAGVS